MKNSLSLLSLILFSATAIADDWPQWGGPQRDIVWRESGIVETLPTDGLLPRLWSAAIGEGYSGPAVANGRVYLTDRIHEDSSERVQCFDVESGKEIWKKEYPARYTVSYPAGPRATPVIDDGRVFTIGAVGHMYCFDAKTGDEIWKTDFQTDFGTKLPIWGMAASPLVDGDRLITLVGGEDGSLVVAFDKATGQEIWRSLDDPMIGYAPPMIFEFGGRRQLIIWHPSAVSSLDPESGEVIWEVPWKIRSGLSIPMPRKSGDHLFLTAFYNGPMMLKVGADGAIVVWKGNSNSEKNTEGLHSIMPTPWLTTDNVFGVGSYGQLRGLDAKTGKRLWETFDATGEGRWWNAFIIPHEDRFFLHNEQGDLITAELTADGYKETSRAKLVEPTRKVQRRMTIWSHPAFAMKSVFAQRQGTGESESGKIMWEPFLSSKRIGSSKPAAERTEVSRSEFHKDYDRIIFSGAFRRLSDKTQVVPFPKSDYTRQRLTHSLEVSCVGRSLATSVYEMVRGEVGKLVSQGDFEAIVAAACLAHDIGNPPFGHFGEKAIQDWAKCHLDHPDFESLSCGERADLTLFEGNAQSFRVLTRLQMSNRRGGMRLTAATLGALVKYPRPSHSKDTDFKKHGFFQDDAELFGEVFKTAGRKSDRKCQFARHPLALLSEAADDICYAIIDLEDGCKAGLIPVDKALGILEKINSGCTGSSDMPDSDRLSMGRAMSINALVNQSAEVFQENIGSILEGTFQGSLIKQVPSSKPYSKAKKVAYQQVFNSERVLELEAAGYRAIQGLLDILTAAALTESPNGFDQHVCKLTNLLITSDMSQYQKLLACTDKVSGMTDRYCIELFRKLSGHTHG